MRIRRMFRIYFGMRLMPRITWKRSFIENGRPDARPPEKFRRSKPDLPGSTFQADRSRPAVALHVHQTGQRCWGISNRIFQFMNEIKRNILSLNFASVSDDLDEFRWIFSIKADDVKSTAVLIA